MYIFGRHLKEETQIKMPLYNVPNFTSGSDTGMDTLLIGVMGTVPSFVPLLLFFVFMFVLLGGITSQRKRTQVFYHQPWPSSFALGRR